MANEEHLKRLLQGVHLWNQWTPIRHGPVIIDPRGVDLRSEDLRGIDFRGVDLSMADLRGVSLQDADFEAAILRGAKLSWAYLSRARLWETKLNGADLSRVNLSGADLSRANLSGADLSGAILLAAKLNKANLDGAIITDACLWGTQREGWSIQGIVCEAAYWDKDRRERTRYSPGEFERLYADQTKIVLHYEGGISPIEIATLPALIQRMETAHPGCILRLQSVQEAPGGATVTLVVENEGGRHPDELRTLKADIETVSRRAIRYQRALFAERDKRAQAERKLQMAYDEILPWMREMAIEKSQGIHIRDSTWNPEEKETLARFVMPHTSQIEEVLDAVRSALMDGVATIRVQKLAAALYKELVGWHIIYDYEPLSLGVAQRVRLPHELLTDGTAKATCLDLSLFWAGCIEAAQGEPLVLQFMHKWTGNAHAIAGLWLRPPARREVVYQHPTVFALTSPCNILVVETTSVTVNRRENYREALRAARALFTDPDWLLRFAIDIAEARRREIMPWNYWGQAR